MQDAEELFEDGSFIILDENDEFVITEKLWEQLCDETKEELLKYVAESDIDCREWDNSWEDKHYYIGMKVHEIINSIEGTIPKEKRIAWKRTIARAIIELKPRDVVGEYHLINIGENYRLIKRF